MQYATDKTDNKTTHSIDNYIDLFLDSVFYT